MTQEDFKSAVELQYKIEKLERQKKALEDDINDLIVCEGSDEQKLLLFVRRLLKTIGGSIALKEITEEIQNRIDKRIDKLKKEFEAL